MRDTPELRGLARRLLAHEAGEADDSSRLAAGAELVCQKIGQQLVFIVGPLAVRAILARALTVTPLGCAEAAHVTIADQFTEAGPLLRGLRECVTGQAPRQTTDSLTGFLATLLALLVSLMGTELTYTILRAAWPELKIG